MLSLEDGQVRFAYRDRRDDDQRKAMQLPAEEFIGRFLKHTLPGGFMRVRHYGLLANRAKKARLARCRELLGTSPPDPQQPKTPADWILLWTGEDITRCPRCGHDQLISEEIPKTSPPKRFTLDDAFW